MTAAVPVARRPWGMAFLSFLHQSTSILAALGLIAMIWLWHPAQNVPKTAEQAASHIFWVAVITLVYLAVQAIATLSHPIGSERRVLVDIGLSALPLLVVIYALVDWTRGSLQPNLFQQMAMSLWGLATLIDTIIFSLFALRIIRRTSEVSFGGGH